MVNLFHLLELVEYRSSLFHSGGFRRLDRSFGDLVRLLRLPFLRPLPLRRVIVLSLDYPFFISSKGHSRECPLFYLSAPIGDSARCTFKRPRPNTASVPGAPRSSAVSSRISRVFTAFVPNWSITSAAAADTIGAASDVPRFPWSSATGAAM